jgi:hypothetical protein
MDVQQASDPNEEMDWLLRSGGRLYPLDRECPIGGRNSGMLEGARFPI